MIMKEITVAKKDGLLNKDCSMLVQRAMRFSSDIFLEYGTRKINCKSIMGLISLGLKAGAKFILITKGDDEEAAIADMLNLFDTNFA